MNEYVDFENLTRTKIPLDDSVKRLPKSWRNSQYIGEFCFPIFVKGNEACIISHDVLTFAKIKALVHVYNADFFWDDEFAEDIFIPIFETSDVNEVVEWIDSFSSDKRMVDAVVYEDINHPFMSFFMPNKIVWHKDPKEAALFLRI